MSEYYDELSEMCPHCDCESEHFNIDPSVTGYIARCSECGAQICLCTACMMADDNKDGFCDWRIARQNDSYEMGKCFRGVTFNKKELMGM